MLTCRLRLISPLDWRTCRSRQLGLVEGRRATSRFGISSQGRTNLRWMYLHGTITFINRGAGQFLRQLTEEFDEDFLSDWGSPAPGSSPGGHLYLPGGRL